MNGRFDRYRRFLRYLKTLQPFTFIYPSFVSVPSTDKRLNPRGIYRRQLRTIKPVFCRGILADASLYRGFFPLRSGSFALSGRFSENAFWLLKDV